MHEDLKKTLMEPHLVEQSAQEQSISQQAHTGDADTPDVARFQSNTISASASASDASSNQVVTSLVYTLPKQYEILDQLGRGGMGTVFRARHKDLQKMVAIKVINPELLQKEGVATTAGKRFLAEAKAVSRLKHDNLVVLYEYGMTAEGAAYMIMEYASGDSLDKYLNRKETLSQEEALAIIMDVCHGLNEAHKNGIVHRDIKPANIILTDNGKRLVPKILDFGIARVEEGGHTQGITATGEVFGSPLYIAPEQSMTSKVDGRADIYSLGCVLFEMLSGHPPYLGENAIQTIMMHLKDPVPHLSEVMPPLKGGLADVIYKCMDKDPAQRYQSIDALLEDLEKVKQGQRTDADGMYLRNKTAPESARDRLIAAAANSKTIAGRIREAKSNAGQSNRKLLLMITIAVTMAIVGLAKITFDNFALPPQSGGHGGQPIHSGGGPPVDLVQKALDMDGGEAFSDYNAGRYEDSAIKLRGAVGVYDDAIESIDEQMKNAKGAERTKLWNKRHRIAYLRVENYQHIADCYVHLKMYQEAANAYAKGFTYMRELYQRRTASPQLVYHYKSYIAVLRLAGRNQLADELQKELELLMKMPGST